jgi:hypothetical protein
MDQYEVRTWTGWRRHILLVIIDHLFLTKLRHEFADRSNAWRGTPIIDEPVEVDEFRQAVLEFLNQEEISNPKIKAYPTDPQHICTVSLPTKLVLPFFT